MRGGWGHGCFTPIQPPQDTVPSSRGSAARWPQGWLADPLALTLAAWAGRRGSGRSVLVRFPGRQDSGFS